METLNKTAQRAKELKESQSRKRFSLIKGDVYSYNKALGKLWVEQREKERVA